MADLLENRVTPALPFTYICMLQWIILVHTLGKKVAMNTRYRALLTWLVSKAVHIEVAHSLKTDCFLPTFISHRGPVPSDNRTKFGGAKTRAM